MAGIVAISTKMDTNRRSFDINFVLELPRRLGDRLELEQAVAIGLWQSPS